MLCGYRWFVFWKSFALAAVLVAGAIHLLARRVLLPARVAAATLLALLPQLTGRGYWIN